MNICTFDEINTVNHHLDCKKHSHKNCEFLFVLSGSINNIVDADSADLSVGDICFMNTNAAHTLVYSAEKSWHRDLFISNEHLKFLCSTFYDEEFFNHLTKSKKNIVIQLNSGHFDSIISKLSTIEINYKCNKIDKDFYIKSLFNIIVELLGELYYSLHTASENNVINESLIMLLHKLNSPDFFLLPIPEIIKETNYSHSHFDLLFKKNLGCTIKSYVTNLKINYAKELLTNTTLSLSAIARKLNYDSQSHFTQVFKKIANLSPKEYRKLHNKT